MTAHAAAITQALAARTGTDPGDWFLVFKARYGMQVVLAAIEEARGPGEVATQIFTCATAVDPILAAGLTPVYAEVSPETIAIDPARLVPGERTRAVMLQHTFGIIDEPTAAGLRTAADAAGALLLEDSAHCVGRTAAGPDGAPLADVSFHSFGVEKMMPTRFGGAVWVDPQMADTALRARIVDALGALRPVGRRLDVVTRLYRTQIRVLNRLPRQIAGPVRRALTAVGAFEPAIAPVEQRGGLPHRPFAPSPWMLAQAAAHLPNLAADEARRSAVVELYAEALAGVVQVPDGARSGPLVRFPFFAADEATADRLVAALNAAGVYAGKWYRPALFPGAVDPAVYGYVPGDGALATTEDLVSRVVNLPTGIDLDHARRAVEVVRSITG